eukprot:2184653-Pleurochrysis_carterae.AAC.1
MVWPRRHSIATALRSLAQFTLPGARCSYYAFHEDPRPVKRHGNCILVPKELKRPISLAKVVALSPYDALNRSSVHLCRNVSPWRVRLLSQKAAGLLLLELPFFTRSPNLSRPQPQPFGITLTSQREVLKTFFEGTVILSASAAKAPTLSRRFGNTTFLGSEAICRASFRRCEAPSMFDFIRLSTRPISILTLQAYTK